VGLVDLYPDEAGKDPVTSQWQVPGMGRELFSVLQAMPCREPAFPHPGESESVLITSGYFSEPPAWASRHACGFRHCQTVGMPLGRSG
jgi:hypothetical protein